MKIRLKISSMLFLVLMFYKPKKLKVKIKTNKETSRPTQTQITQ